MTSEQFEAQSATKQLVQCILDLSLISHVTGTSYDRSGGGSKGVSGPPPGGIDAKGDREPAFRQKSAPLFQKRLEGLTRKLSSLEDSEIESIRDEILDEARAALKAWRKAPQVPGKDPEKGTLAWKIKVANDPRSSRIVASHHGISHVTVLRLRQEYLGVQQ